MNKKEPEQKLVFISYLNDDNDVFGESSNNSNSRVIRAWVELIGEPGIWVKFRTKEGNVLWIPHHRILKIKERGQKNGEPRSY